jgi:hypothetical protein
LPEKRRGAARRSRNQTGARLSQPQRVQKQKDAAHNLATTVGIRGGCGWDSRAPGKSSQHATKVGDSTAEDAEDRKNFQCDGITISSKLCVSPRPPRLGV